MAGDTFRSWLSHAVRPADPAVRFAIADITEDNSRPGETESWMADRITAERFHPALLEDMVYDLGWEDAQEVVAAGLPALPLVRKGVLGEVLASECIEAFDGYTVPIRKLRAMLSPKDSLHGTDVLAFLVNAQGDIAKACYIEAKLRTGAYPGVATEAEEQLAKDMEARYPAILTFVANQILEQHHLSAALRRYIHRRNRGEVLDEFRLHLTWESSTWSELALERLRDADERLKPLDVCVVRLSELDMFITNVYGLAGIGIEDGDD